MTSKSFLERVLRERLQCSLAARRLPASERQLEREDADDPIKTPLAISPARATAAYQPVPALRLGASSQPNAAWRAGRGSAVRFEN